MLRDWFSRHVSAWFIVVLNGYVPCCFFIDRLAFVTRLSLQPAGETEVIFRNICVTIDLVIPGFEMM